VLSKENKQKRETQPIYHGPPLGAPKLAGFPGADGPPYEKPRPATVFIWAVTQDFKPALRPVSTGSESHASTGRARSPRVSSPSPPPPRHPLARLLPRHGRLLHAALVAVASVCLGAAAVAQAG
jgi:hypothetical protein